MIAARQRLEGTDTDNVMKSSQLLGARVLTVVIQRPRMMLVVFKQKGSRHPDIYSIVAKVAVEGSLALLL